MRLLKLSLILLLLAGCSPNGTEAERRAMRDACVVANTKDKPEFIYDAAELMWMSSISDHCWNVAANPSLLDRLRY